MLSVCVPVSLVRNAADRLLKFASMRHVGCGHCHRLGGVGPAGRNAGTDTECDAVCPRSRDGGMKRKVSGGTALSSQ